MASILLRQGCVIARWLLPGPARLTYAEQAPATVVRTAGVGAPGLNVLQVVEQARVLGLPAECLLSVRA